MNKQARSRKFTAKQSSRLGAYLAAGVASSMATASDSEAAVVYFPVDPAKVVVTGDSFEGITFSSINLQNASYIFNQDPTTAPAFTLFLEGQSNVFGFGGNGINFATVGYDYYFPDSTALRFNYNDPIGVAQYFGTQATSMNAANGWLPGTTGYIGLRMELDGQLHYGWATLNFGLNLEDPVTISGFAFESEAGTSIPAGVIPEPSTVALAGIAALVLGGSAYARSRRREEAQIEAA